MNESQHGQDVHPASGEAARQSAVARAEELVGRFEQQTGPFLARLVARAREEIEDIWAEIESVRQSKRTS
jgi:hypothetical protein